jgi:predicted ester cyclase
VNERRERLFREFIAAFQACDIDSVRTIVDPDIVDHTLPPGGTRGIEGLLYAVNAYREGFPDLRITVDKVVSDGDCVVGYGLISGTNTGSFFGMPPSGKTAEFSYIDIYRINAGRISEAWHLEDIAGLMRQIATATPHGVTT